MVGRAHDVFLGVEAVMVGIDDEEAFGSADLSGGTGNELEGALRSGFVLLGDVDVAAEDEVGSGGGEALGNVVTVIEAKGDFAGRAFDVEGVVHEDDADGIGVAGEVETDFVEGLGGDGAGGIPEGLGVFIGVDGVEDNLTVEAGDGL